MPKLQSPKSKTFSSTKSLLKISVIIPGHNRPDSLRETLNALREQTLSPKYYEVIMVGFVGTSLQEVANENAKIAKHSFQYVEIGTRWPDAKRNEGIRLSKSPIIAFTDDDVLPQKDWLEKIIEKFEENPDALGVEGATEGDNTPLLSHATKNVKGNEFPTCNMSFRKEILMKVNGFDEAYHFFREDTDIAYQVLQHGKIIFSPEVKVFHPTRKTKPAQILNELEMIRGEIRLYKKFPKLYSKNYLQKFPKIIGRGGWLQAAVSWTVVFGIITTAIYAPHWFFFSIVMGIIVLFLFRFLLSFRNRTSTWIEKISVFIYMLVRDLAYPFFFVYFWITENPIRAEKTHF